MDTAIGNTVRLGEVSLQSALTMATRNAARVGRIHHRQRGLAPGERADLVAFRWDEGAKTLIVEQTWLGGEQVFVQAV